MSNLFRDNLYNEFPDPNKKIEELSDKVDNADDKIGILQKKVNFINVEEFPRLNVENDDTGRFQRTIDASVSNGYANILLSNSLTISNTVVTPQDFKQPFIIGKGYKNTTINYSSMPKGKSALKFKGGSGSLASGGIMFVGFNGNIDSIGVELADCCGVTVSNCQFGLNKTGVLFHNESVGGFTEYCVVSNSDFKDSCSIAVEYKKTGGNESFHGSGLKDCTIVQTSNETNSKIVIGSGCLPYNSPLGFQVWVYCQTPIINHQGLDKSSFYGTITSECFGSNYKTVLSTNKPLYYVGNVLNYDSKLSLGTLLLCERVQQNPDGSLSVQRKPYQTILALNQGLTETVKVGNNGVAIVNFLIYAPNYEYSYTLNVYRNLTDDNGSVNILATNRNYNVAGYDAPAFGLSNGKLTITNNNFPSTGVTAYITVSELQGRTDYPLN